MLSKEQLDPAVFFRAGRKQIINLRSIEKVDITAGGELGATLRGGRTVEMSRRQSAGDIKPVKDVMEMGTRIGTPAESRRHGRKPYRIPLKTRHQPGWGFHPLKWRAAPSRQPGLAAPQEKQI